MHDLNIEALAVVAACVVVWGVFSARLERVNVTAPIAFVVLGLAVTHDPLNLMHLNLNSSTLRSVAELTLALVLFSDASRVNVRALRAEVRLPVRLLAIGLPLTIGAGMVAALAIFTGINIWVAALIGAIVAPTDAALGASILGDERIPSAVRRLLNVESGLNDGIATPFVNLFLAGALSEEAISASGVSGAVVDLLVGAGVGVGVGVGGAFALRTAQSRGWSAPAFRPLAVLGLALFAYSAAVGAGGNGFVAAFSAGMAFGSMMPQDDPLTLGFTDDTGELLSLLVWFAFGATMLVDGFELAGWQDVVFAVLALTVVRMVPVAVSLIGSGLDRNTVAFIGWFGPRGLASVVFGLIAVDSLARADADLVLAVVTVTVALSVVAHGLSAAPLASRYGRYAATKLAAEDPEHTSAPSLPTRSLAGDRLRASGRSAAST
ncbi:MAG TPA: cation:proton antiporter [Acidimicrobiales bacterium]|nr:cation:proton antiporter [Acidimicrobiales bacterium]